MYLLMSFKTFGQVQSFWHELMCLPPIRQAARPQVSINTLLSVAGGGDPW